MYWVQGTTQLSAGHGASTRVRRFVEDLARTQEPTPLLLGARRGPTSSSGSSLDGDRGGEDMDCSPINYKKLWMSRLHVRAQRRAGLSDFVEVTVGSHARSSIHLLLLQPGRGDTAPQTRLASQNWELAGPSQPRMPHLPSAWLQDRVCRAAESSAYDAVPESISALRKEQM